MPLQGDQSHALLAVADYLAFLTFSGNDKRGHYLFSILVLPSFHERGNEYPPVQRNHIGDVTGYNLL